MDDKGGLMSETDHFGSANSWLEYDRKHLWHPYTGLINPTPVFPVESAQGCRIMLADGRSLIDGMSSWWSAIHGYNHPVLNLAISSQISSMSHVMFGGLTHQPAVELARKLIEITPETLQYVFLADSGSVSVEVALKMAIQYQHTRGKEGKCKFLTPRGGYHGDTFGAMAVCDPVNGMHSLFTGVLPKHIFSMCPSKGDVEDTVPEAIADFQRCIETHHEELAAVILEPLVQGAGGMRFYSTDYLKQVRALCDQFDVLLIFDEIATGFGRTGTMFAADQAGVTPDIMCVGKALTGGYMTLAAVLANEKVALVISDNGNGVLMHGPTFMGNPLACSVANASIDLLRQSDWQAKVENISHQLMSQLKSCTKFKGVRQVRVKGAIGVVELEDPVDMSVIQPMFVESGVWVRPFGKLVYIMPPYIISSDELSCLTRAIYEVLDSYLAAGQQNG